MELLVNRVPLVQVMLDVPQQQTAAVQAKRKASVEGLVANGLQAPDASAVKCFYNQTLVK